MRKVPFYSNTKDNTHCFQACIKIVLKYYFPSEKYSYHQLDKITGKKKNKWTWPMTGILYLCSRGLELVHINKFNYSAFGKSSYSYLKRVWKSKTFYDAQVANSDIPYESITAQIYSTKRIHKQRSPNMSDLYKLLSKDYLLICNVNYYALHNLPGYSGHFVVAYDIDDNNIYIQDPGLPGHKNEVVALNTFINAWGGTDLIGIKKPQV